MGWYRSGTVVVNNGSPTVTGTGTQWQSVAKVKAGDEFRGPDYGSYEILTVNSDGSITLAEDYRGSSLSGASYAIKPLVSPMRDLVEPVEALVTDYTTVKNDAGSGRFDGGSVSAPGIKSKTDLDTGLSWPADNVMVLGAAADEVARVAASSFTLSKNVGVKNAAPAADIHVGSGSAATLGSTAPLVWVSARALSNGAGVSPQDLLRLSWQEGSQDLISGEGVAIAFAASLAGDAGTFYPVVRIAARKDNSSDSSRVSSLVFQTSSDGTAAPTDAVVIGADNVLQAVGGVKFGAGTSVLTDYVRPTEFTPVLADAASGGNVATGSVMQGSYTKIGSWVTITILMFDINTTGMTAGSDLYIRGLPYAARSTPNNQFFIGGCRLSQVAFSGFVQPMIQDGTSYIRLPDNVSNSGSAPLKVSALTSGNSDIWVTISYETDA